MNIALFTSSYPYPDNISHPEYPTGGSILATYNVISHINKRNFNFRIFTSSDNSQDQFEKQDGMEIYRYGTKFRFLASNISPGIFYKPLNHMCNLAHVSFDIPPSPFAGLRYANNKKVPLVVTYHGDWFLNEKNMFRNIAISIINKFIVDKLLSRADAIICPSRNYSKISPFLKEYTDKIKIIPNGINLNDFATPLQKDECRNKLGISLHSNILLFIGSLIEHKGPGILINAMPEILSHEPKTELFIIGDGPLLNNLKYLSKKLQLDDRVHFLGFIGDNYIKSLYFRASDLFILPSLIECYPIVLLEAIACGIPIIASNVGGVPEIVQESKNGILFLPGDTMSLTQNIVSLLSNRKLQEDMKENGLAWIKDYSWKSIAYKTEMLYSEILQNV